MTYPGRGTKWVQRGHTWTPGDVGYTGVCREQDPKRVTLEERHCPSAINGLRRAYLDECLPSVYFAFPPSFIAFSFSYFFTVLNLFSFFFFFLHLLKCRLPAYYSWNRVSVTGADSDSVFIGLV